MEALGYSLTWTTACFIGEGCGEKVFGHTNGYGDFVLLDELNPPWPVHECYLRRFELSARSNSLRIQHTRDVPVSLQDATLLPRQFVRLETIATARSKTFSVIATVVDVFETIQEWRKELRKDRVYGKRSELMYNQAQGNRSVLRLYTGRDEEFYVLVDLRRHRVRFRDVVAATLQQKKLLDDEIFVLLECKRFRST